MHVIARNMAKFISYNFRKVAPARIENSTEKLIAEQRALYDTIGSVPLSEVTYSNVIKAVDNVMRERSTKGAWLCFAQQAAIDKLVRDASFKAETKILQFDVEMSMRKDVFDRIVQFKEKCGFDGLTEEQIRYVNKLILAGKRNGLHLSDKIQTELKTIKKRMSELSSKFQNNVNEDNTKLFFTKEELAGMPEDFISALNKREDGKLEVTLKYPHLFPITKKCRISNTRKMVTIASQSLCMEENTPVLEELIELRQTQADLLGYPNHASFIQEERMAKSPKKVAVFLSDLGTKLQKLWKDEKDEMFRLKNEECKELGYENSGDLEFWDFRYFMNKIEETVYAVDEEEVRQYFPIEKVTSGLLDIYQRLLGLTFTADTEIEAWHPDVTLFRVNDTETSTLMGYFFLDLHPRDGKFNHAAVFPLEPSCLLSDGTRQPSVCAMMCNFTKPTKDKLALLSHSEVETYFHEFGHVMHNICAQSSFSLFHGTRVERDFLEAPSQMLENWVWEKEPLKLMSAHHMTGEPLPDTLVEKLAQSRKANAGGFNLRQIALSTFDQRIHTRRSANTKDLYAQTYQEIVGIRPIPNTNMPASFAHLASSYDAQYYGYLWSEVFAMDMYESRFKKEGILNPAVGMEYRKKILQPGGTKDAAVMLVDFLGREPSNEAFLKSKGL